MNIKKVYLLSYIAILNEIKDDIIKNNILKYVKVLLN